MLLNGLAIVVVGAAVVMALLVTRYEYHWVSLADGDYYAYQHDKWTGRECVVYSTVGDDLLPYGLGPCEAAGMLKQASERVARD